MDQGAISRGGQNGPYADSSRQAGFVDFGASHLMKTFASLELSQKASWYQKWNVHLFARPEVRECQYPTKGCTPTLASNV